MSDSAATSSPHLPLHDRRPPERAPHELVDGQFEIWKGAATGCRALHARGNHQAGELVAPFGARSVRSEPDYLSVQVGPERHILLAPPHLELLNHSCAPNLYFDVENSVLRALRSIAPGDELSFFYPSTEWHMAQPFPCHCQAPGCLGSIRGAAHLPMEVLARYRLNVHIQRLLAERGTPLAPGRD